MDYLSNLLFVNLIMKLGKILNRKYITYIHYDFRKHCFLLEQQENYIMFC